VTTPPASAQLALRRLLWLDALAGLGVGAAMLALTLAGVLAPLLGLTTRLLLVTAAANLAYGSYACSLAVRARAPRRAAVAALIAANLTWTGVCVVLAASVAGPGRWLGAGYLLGEGVVVGALALVERRALARARLTP
jgi:hypothetical protein